MNLKTRAILSVVATVVLTIFGLIIYQDGNYFEWFGIINISKGLFLGLMGIWIVVGIFGVVNAFKKEKALEEKSVIKQKQLSLQEQLESPCNVSITRTSSLLGAAMGVRVFLNDTEVGILKNAQTLSFTSQYAENELAVLYSEGITKSMVFTAEPGENVSFTLKYSGAALTKN